MSAETRGPRHRPAAARSRSHAVLLRLHALPRWVVPLATAVLVFLGLSAGPVIGALCLLAVAAFLGWLGYLAWPRTTVGGRLARTGVVAALVGVGLARLLGSWG